MRVCRTPGQGAPRPTAVTAPSTGEGLDSEPRPLPPPGTDFSQHVGGHIQRL